MATKKTTKVAAKTNRYKELKKMLEERRRDLLNEVQDKIRDVRSESGKERDVLDQGEEVVLLSVLAREAVGTPVHQDVDLSHRRSLPGPREPRQERVPRAHRHSPRPCEGPRCCAPAPAFRP